MREITPMQLQLYAIDRAGIGQMMMLTASGMLETKVSDAEMQRAANELFRLNGELRARFVEKEDGKVYQVNEPYAEQTFEVLHFGSKEELDEWGQLYATMPLKLDIRSEGKGIPAKRWQMFKPTVGQIVKGIAAAIRKNSALKKRGIVQEQGVCAVKLVQLPDRSGILIKMHHVVSDGWTMMLLTKQLLELLGGGTPVAYDYDEFIAADAKYRQSKRYERDHAFFEEQKAAHPERPRLWTSQPSSMDGVRTKLLVDGQDIRAYAQANGTSPYILFLTALSIYAAQELQLGGFWVNTISINRSGVRERNMVGTCVNTIPMHLSLDEDGGFMDAIKVVSDANLATFRHQKGWATDLKFACVFGFGYLDPSFIKQADGTDVEITEYFNNCTYGRYFSVQDNGEGKPFQLNIDHNLEIHPLEEANEILRRTAAILSDGIADDGRKITELGR